MYHRWLLQHLGGEGGQLAGCRSAVCGGRQAAGAGTREAAKGYGLGFVQGVLVSTAQEERMRMSLQFCSLLHKLGWGQGGRLQDTEGNCILTPSTVMWVRAFQRDQPRTRSTEAERPGGHQERVCSAPQGRKGETCLPKSDTNSN